MARRGGKTVWIERLKDALALGISLALVSVLLIRFAQGGPVKPELPPVQTQTGDGIALLDGRVLVDINTADEEMLMDLPGVGEEIARRIVEYREQNGPFANVDELLRVSGIGKAKLEGMRDMITAWQ